LTGCCHGFAKIKWIDEVGEKSILVFLRRLEEVRKNFTVALVSLRKVVDEREDTHGHQGQ
jgi:hypothetical protein